jgi:hypothetical protein
MIKQSAPRYTYPREKWDEKKCRKLARAIQRDGVGTPYPFRGYVGNILRKTQDYNGGTVINDEWYQGVIHLLPEIPPNFQFVMRISWGYQIIEVQS